MFGFCSHRVLVSGFRSARRFDGLRVARCRAALRACQARARAPAGRGLLLLLRLLLLLVLLPLPLLPLLPLLLLLLLLLLPLRAWVDSGWTRARMMERRFLVSVVGVRAVDRDGRRSRVNAAEAGVRMDKGVGAWGGVG